MSAVRTFRVTGEIRKPNLLEPMKFTKEIQATKREHALERIYTDVGSRHHAKRYQIRIIQVEEIEASPEAQAEEGRER